MINTNKNTKDHYNHPMIVGRKLLKIVNHDIVLTSNYNNYYYY